MIASHATGSEMPTSASTVIALSVKRPALTAEIVPTSTPKPSQMIAAPMQSEKVSGSPSSICWTTFVPS